MNDPVLTIPEVAEYLRISKSKIYYLVSRNQIPHLKIGRNVRIRESDLQAWMESQIIVERPSQLPLAIYLDSRNAVPKNE